METMYQRGKIQEESLHYETLKHSGDLTIVGVNTFLSSQGSPTIIPGEVIRATNQEKENQIKNLESLHSLHQKHAERSLQDLQQAAIEQKNLFTELMETTKWCTLGQITEALFDVGGQYRRSM
jgi:methylmalonyl-CoA mutase